MSLVDDRGRVFGRLNLIDAMAIGFVLVLVPLAYGTYLLFRPAQPQIESVTAVPIGKEEERLARGGLLGVKLKLKGTGFNPLLRAWIGDTPALAFMFENPNSADILAAPIAAGTHDLILFDGAQEVARARAVIAGPPAAPGSRIKTVIRGAGRFMNLSPDVAKSLDASLGAASSEAMFTIVALGPVVPGRSRVTVATSQADFPIADRVEREAIVDLVCDPSREDDPCARGDRISRPSVTLSLAGPSGMMQFDLREIFPATPPRRARVQVLFSLTSGAFPLQIGDRDSLLDTRAAVVTDINHPTPNAGIVTLDMGVDDSREGWRYRSQRVKAGLSLYFAAERYEGFGVIQSVRLTDDTAPRTQ